MSKDDKQQTPVPRLRFPEFRNAPEWDQAPLGEIADIKLGKMLDTKKHTTGRLFPYLNNLALRWNEVDTTNLPQMYFGDDELERFGLRAGDVVVCEGGEPGRSAVWDGRLPELKFQKAIHRVRFNVPFEPRLLVLYLEAIAGTAKFKSLFTGGGIKHLTRETFEQLTVPILSIAEQRKITDCLRSLDDLIVAEARKLEALRDHKRGLMQQLFPREGETLPHFRFPEFRNTAEWDMKAIGEIFRVTRGEVLAMSLVKGQSSSDSPYPVYSSQTKNNGLAGYYSEFLYQDAITWTTDGANAGKVKYRQGKFYCTNVCGVLLNADGHANSCIAALLNAVTRKYVSYVGNPKLMNAVMSEIRVPFPSLEEQKRLATCLDSIDAVLDAQIGKLDALRIHKRGLMQQLFPSPEDFEA